MERIRTVWSWLEDWSARMLVVGGVLLLLQTVSDVLTLTMDLKLEALAFAPFIGLILSYLGILGLYQPLSDRAPRLSRIGLVLILAPVVALIVLIGALVSSSGMPFSESVGTALVTTIFTGYAVGVVLFGIAMFLTKSPSRAVGIAVFGFAAGWFVLLGASIAYGFPISDWLTFISDGLMATSVLATGVLHLTATPLERAERADTVA